MNLMLVGLSGFGKFMYLKCILKYCYNIDICDFKPHKTLLHVFSYESIYLIDFIFIKKSYFKDVFNFIKVINKRNFIQFNNIPKIIILKNIDVLNNDNISKILTIIKSFKTVFIILSKKNIISYRPFFTVIRLKYLSEKEMKSSINKLFKSKNINIKDTILTHKKIYKTYRDTFYNFKDTLLWIQHTLNQTKISKETKIVMPIKNKMIASLLNYIFSDTSKMKSTKELDIFEQMYNKIIILSGTGIENNDIIKYTTRMLLQNKIIEHNKKTKIVELLNDYSNSVIKVEREIFSIKTFFYKLMILFK